MTPATAGPCYVADVDLCKAWVDGMAIAEKELGVAVECKEGFGLFAPHGTVLEVDNKDLEEDDYIYSDDVIESSDNLIVHGQLMPFEHRPGPDLHVWNGMLNPRIVQVRGENCQFVTLESNVENRWYQQTTTLKALAEWCIQCAPTVVPTIPRDPYPCMPTVPTDDKMATESGPNSVKCRICRETVPHRVLRTHVGQHILRGHHIEGQGARSRANVCGFCGSRDECTIRLPLQSRSTRRRMVVAVTTCPSQPCAISWSQMSTATKANPCTNFGCIVRLRTLRLPIPMLPFHMAFASPRRRKHVSANGTLVP